MNPDIIPSDMSSWSTYIVQCVDGSLYTGISTDVPARVETHNAGKGSAYTRSHRPVVLVWTEESGTRSAASKREAELKRLSRAEKEHLLTASLPARSSR